MKDLQLTIELVPASAWNQNLRNILPKNAWEKIRREVFEKSGNKCSICGSKARLNCHEVWNYDDGASYQKRNPSCRPQSLRRRETEASVEGDKKHIQKLAGFLALCNLCHAVKHIGFSGLEKPGSPGFDKVIKHFMKVNNCSRQTFLDHQKEAYEKFEERSHFEWSLDLGPK